MQFNFKQSFGCDKGESLSSEIRRKPKLQIEESESKLFTRDGKYLIIKKNVALHKFTFKSTQKSKQPKPSRK